MRVLFWVLNFMFFTAVSIGQNAVIDTTSIEAQFDQKEVGIVKLYRAGKLKACLDTAEQVLNWIQAVDSDNPVLLGRALNNVATTLNWNGKNKEAIAYFEKSKQVLAKVIHQYPDIYSDIINNQGMTYKDMGRYAEALPLLKEGVTFCKAAYGENHYAVSVALNNLSLLHGSMNDKKAAIHTMRAAIEVTEKSVGKEHRRYAVRVGALANYYSDIGVLDTAVQLLEGVLPVIVEKYGKAHPGFTSAANNLVNTYMQLGALKKARTLMDEVLVNAEKVYGKDHRVYGIYLTSSAELYALEENWEAALTTINQALDSDLNIYGENSRDYLLTAMKRSAILAKVGQLNLAAEAYQEIQQVMIWLSQNQFPFFSEKEQDQLMTTLRNGSYSMYSFAYQHPTVIGQAALAYNQNLLIKNTLRNNTKNLLQNLKENEEETIKKKAKEWFALKSQLSQQYKLRIAKQTLDLDSLTKRANDLERQLATSTFHLKQNKQPVQWQSVQANLGAADVAIEFGHFPLFDREKTTDSVLYVAYLLTADAPPVQIPLFEEKELGNIKASRHLYATTSKPGKKNLKQLIWEPLSTYLVDKKKIYFSSSGVLHRINFGAIPINATRTIAEKYDLYQLGSTGQLLSQSNTTVNIKDATIFGGIQYDEEGTIQPTSRVATRRSLEAIYKGGNWDYLAYTEKEVERIQSLLQREQVMVKSLTKLAASEEHFKQLGKQNPAPDLLHLATHAYFYPKPKSNAATGFKGSKNPLIRSGLILAGANAAWQGAQTLDGAEDGVLTAYEIAQMDLSNTKLVVLSACETGLGDIKENEGVYGLQRAFKIAGVGYILMSLWSVDDEKTYEFMTRFYELWQQEKMPIPKAFQQTQNEMKQKYQQPFNPSSWAGFVLME